MDKRQLALSKVTSVRQLPPSGRGVSFLGTGRDFLLAEFLGEGSYTKELYRGITAGKSPFLNSPASKEMDRLPSESLNLQTKSRLAVSSHSDAVKSTQEGLAVAASRIRDI